MVPARNLLRRHYDTYRAWFGDTHNSNSSSNNNNKPSVLRSDPMAEDHSRTNGNSKQDEEEEEDEAGTSSKDDWLQLAIGCSSATTQVTSSGAQEGRVELELFSNRPSSISSPPPLPPPPPPLPGGSTMMGAIPPAMPVFPPHGLTYRRETPWGFWNPNPMVASASSTPPPPPPLQYSFRRFVYPPASSGVPVDVRVVTPPRRPQAGVWFVLQAAQNQVREPFLPQIPKSYLRIKDGRMTVRLLMKYLVNKLGLDDESEVEITCRGQPLLPFLTLQHVRDNIWSLRAAMELLPDSPADHVMTLQYGRSRT